MKVLVSNNSDYDGIIQMNVLQNGWWYQPMEDPRARKKVEIAAHTSKEFVSVWEEQIRDVEINTMVSGNLPYMIRQSIGNVKQERNKNSQGHYLYLAGIILRNAGRGYCG